MELNIGNRLKHAWNAFLNRDPTYSYGVSGSGYSFRPDKARLSRGNEKSIITSIFNRISLDVAQIDIKHCEIDSNGSFVKEKDSRLNSCLTLEANCDQTPRAFIQDVVLSMLDEGVVAIVPVDTYGDDPLISDSFDVASMRTGKILEWKPKHVYVRLYNDATGEKEERWFPKRMIGIVENPLYEVINEPNSTVQRLKRKLALLDVTDEQTASNKLDLIIQLPYTTRSESKRKLAEERREALEEQLSNSKYGVAYADGTEKIIQLNRSVENNLLKQVEYWTNLVYSQLGITQEVMDGTADEKTMLNYMNRTIEPIVSAIVDEMKRKFLTKTARTQGQTIMYFQDPFKLVPISNIAEIADKFTRNCIMTSNELRQVIGMKPSADPMADQLVNNNISQPADQNRSSLEGYEYEEGENQNG